MKQERNENPKPAAGVGTTDLLEGPGIEYDMTPLYGPDGFDDRYGSATDEMIQSASKVASRILQECPHGGSTPWTVLPSGCRFRAVSRLRSS